MLNGIVRGSVFKPGPRDRVQGPVVPIDDMVTMEKVPDAHRYASPSAAPTSAQPAAYTAQSVSAARGRLPAHNIEQRSTAATPTGSSRTSFALMRWQTPIATPAPARTPRRCDSGRTWAAAIRKSERLTQPACRASGITTVEKNTSPG